MRSCLRHIYTLWIVPYLWTAASVYKVSSHEASQTKHSVGVICFLADVHSKVAVSKMHSCMEVQCNDNSNMHQAESALSILF